MNFFRKIQSEGLRRLVKVVLNQTIGPFLESQITLEQLELESETGIFHIKDVPLNCSAINELLIGSAVCICSASVADLTVTVSWAAISDGCKITLNGVRFALCKANNSTTQQPARSSGCATHGSAGVATAPISPTVEEEGVLFLANWIDIVVARFHVELKNIEIEMSGGGMHALQVMIDELHYFNSKPESSGSVASSAVEEALHSISRVPQSIYRTEGRLNPAMTSIAMMSSQEANKSKLLTFSGFRVNIISKERLDANAIPIRSSFGKNSAVFYEYRTELLYCDGKGRVLVCSTNNKLAQMATSDINISLPPIVSSISIKYVSVVTEIMSKLISGPSVAVSDSNVNAASAVVGGQIYGVQDKLRAVTFERTIRVLDKIKEDNEINGPDAALRTGVDVVQIAKMLRMYQNIRHRLEESDEFDTSVYMSDAFRSAIDPTGCNAERVDLKNTDARMGLKTDFDNKGLLSASVISNEEDGIVFSDVDVSSNEDDSSNNDEFFDASEGQGMSRISFKKSAAAFVETVKPAQKSVHPARSVILHKMSGISIRVLLPSFDMAITDSGSHSLKIVLADLTVAVFVPVPSDPMISLPPTNLALKINKISIVEVFIDPDIPVEIPFVYFNEFTNSEDKDVFPYSKSDRSTEASSTEAISLTDNAALELRVEFSNRGRDPEVSSRQVVSDLSISINLNPVVFVICPDSIIRWIAEFQPVMTSNDDERSSSFSIILIVPCVNVILCPVTTPASGLCEPKSLDILHALGIINKDDGSIRQLQYSRWMKRELTVLENARTSLTCINRCVRNNGNIPFLKSPSDKYFRINMLGVRFRLQTENRTKIPANQWYIPIPIIELNEIGAYMRLETDFGAKVMPKTAAFELKFITSFSSRERKISVRKFVESDFSQDSLCEHSKLPAILKSRMSRKEFSRHQNAPTEGNLPGISSKTGPVPPPLHGGEIFVIDAHLIRLGLIDLFVPISNVSSKSDSFGASKIGDSNYVADIVLPKGIGIKLTAEIFLCSLAQDEFIQSNSSISEQNIVKENRNTYVLSTREPLIEFYQSYIPKKSANFSNTFESHIFVGLEVENVSAFELTDDQMKIPHCASGISAIGVRIGPESYNIPIIHVTTFARDWMSPAEDKNPTCTSQETVSGDEIITKDSRNWTLSIGALITEDKELNTRNTVLNLDFQNVTVRYDPLSRSLLNFINVVTPLTLKELLPLYNRENNSVKLLIPKVLQPPAETLHLRVTVHQALLDYCAVVRPSKNYDGSISHPGTLFGAIGPVSAPRILVSLRKMVIGTTIVSTSHQFGLKIGANDVSLRLTNSILRDPRFELIPLDINGILSTQSLSSQQQARGRDYWPCCRFFEDFIDVHAFVRMGKIRKFDLMLRLNGGVKLARSGEEIDDDSDKIDASATIDDIFCCGCADSLNVLADAINTLVADLKEAAAYESPNSINVTAKADVDTIKLKKDHLGLVYKGNLDLSSLNSSSEDDNDDMFTTAKHKDNTSSRHSSNDDLSAIHRNAFISPTKRILKPPLLNIGTISEPVHSNRTAHLSRDNAFEKSEVPSLKTQVNILSGIEKDMFAPRQSNDAMSSRISVRSASDSVLMEAIYDDDYYDSEIRGEDDTVHDIIPVDEYDVQFKRSEKLSSATNKLLGHEQLSAKGNSIAKKQSLFNSEFDEETEVIFLADLPGEEMSEDDSSSDGLPALQEPVAPHWSIFRPKVDKPEDRELLSLPDISSINYQEDVVEMKSPEVYQSSCIQAPTPTAAWKASAAAGTDNGVNLTAYQEETTSLQGEDTFLLVDYSDPMDTGRPEVKWFDGKEQLAAARINPHHIPVLVSAEEAEDIEAVPPKIIVKVKMSVKFQLLHGYDWSTSQNSNSSQLRKLLLKQGSAAKTALSMPHSFFGTAAKNRGAHRVLFPEDTLKPSPSYSSKDAKSKYSMSATDSNKDKAELSLHGVCVRFAMYAPDEVSIATWPVQRTIVKINDIDVKFYRKNHRTKKVLGYWKSQVPRETNAPILHVHLDTFVETVSKSHGSESRYSTVGAINSAGVVSNSESAKFDSDHDIEHVNKISIVLLPLSCHLDAPFLDLVRSLGESFKSDLDVQKVIKQIDEEDDVDNLDKKDKISSVPESMPFDQLQRERPLFFQQWKMSPITLKIYYEPRPFDVIKFQSGDYIEILNCFPLDGLEITMKKTVLYGVTGVQGGVDNTLRLWVDQIRENQLSTIGKVLSGVAPLKGVASIGRGLHHHLFVMPRKEFDRRGTTGALQSVAGGVVAVGSTVIREAMHAGAQATQLLANLLNKVADPLTEEHDLAKRRSRASRHSSEIIDSNGLDNESHSNLRPRNRGTNQRQPSSIAEGSHMAYDAFSSSVANAVDHIVLVPIREYQRSGTGGVISSVIRAVPIAVLGPAAGAAQAASYTFLGMRNQMDPIRRREEEAIFIDIDKSEQYAGSFRG